MAHRDNIIMFDEARSKTRLSREPEGRSNRASENRSYRSRNSRSQRMSDTHASRASEGRGSRFSDGGTARTSRTQSSRTSSIPYTSSTRTSAGRGYDSYRESGRDSQRGYGRGSNQGYSASAPRSTRSPQSRDNQFGFSSRVYDDIFSEPSFDDDVRMAYEEDQVASSRNESAGYRSPVRSKSEQRKRDKASSRAAAQFLNQFGSSHASSSEGGTRAAVYKGEMGRQQKRALSQAGPSQDQSTQQPSHVTHEKKHSSFGRFLIVSASAVVVLLMIGAFLYPAAQQYYIEMRNHDRLQVEYDAVVARNEAIQEDVDHLQTDEGIQDAARTDLGWVQEGENAVIIQGLPDDTESDSGTGVHAQIPSSSIEAPDTWYSGFLDPFFGYSSSTQAKV